MRLLCLNAFEYLRECYPLFQAVCGFSATLSPPAYFQQALGLEQDCKSLVLESVFPADNLRVCIGDYVDTRYRQREHHIDAIADSIAASYRARPGNYLVFFSAYHFMQQVHENFTARYPQIETLLPDGARQHVIGRLNLEEADKCELSMDRNRLFWTGDQKHKIRQHIRMALAKGVQAEEEKEPEHQGYA